MNSKFLQAFKQSIGNYRERNIVESIYILRYQSGLSQRVENHSK